ncbi:MAG: hypothetical protein E7271_07510 [Lachnospiraceae bacterium]|jgi:Na+-transporting methylmalonyl-CoA/oxaloacetate decarboxylase gamma subunit|nr:hypothetical protein [Lachnospiraceae bacterium]
MDGYDDITGQPYVAPSNNVPYDNDGYGQGYEGVGYTDNNYEGSYEGYSSEGFEEVYQGSDYNAGYSQGYGNEASGYDTGYGYDGQSYANDNYGYDSQSYATGYENYSDSINIISNMPRNDVPDNFEESSDESLNTIKGEPTAAELEDMKRERAAKKRKRALREKRRRERRRQAIIRCSILAAAVILVIFLLVKLFAGIGGLIEKNAKKKKTTEAITTEVPTTEEPIANIDEAIVAKDLPASREAALEILKAQAESDFDIKNIVENEAVYPDIVLKHLAVNTELIDFVLHYPAQINIAFDGDFNVETTTSEIPTLLQYDAQWGYADYGQTVLGLNGAAPTCLSIACIYLNHDMSKNPIIVGDYAMSKNYLDENGITDPKLMTEGATELGLESTELQMSKENIISAIEDGSVVICAVNPGDFTREKSYIIIKGFRNGLFYIVDPSSQARSQVGWDYKRLSSQISGIWALKKGSGVATTTEAAGDGTDTGEEGEGTGDGTSTETTGDSTSTDNNNAGDTSGTSNQLPE